MSQCLITGCRLIIPAEGKSLWGDLHQQDGSWVFNGVLEPGNREQASWDYSPEVAVAPEKQIILLDGAPYFEKRAVVVFDRAYGKLNGRALAYVGGTGDVA